MDDPTKFGVVVFKANGQVEKFVEKPQTSVSNKINAGLYIFNHKMIHRVEVYCAYFLKLIFLVK